VDYEETIQLTIFTPFISFLVVLISFVSLLALVAFFTDVGNTNIFYSATAITEHGLTVRILPIRCQIRAL